MPGKIQSSNRPPRSIMHILLAEDNIRDIALIRKALESLDIIFELTIVSNGQQLLNYLVEALELEQESPSRQFPDLVLLDLNFPKFDGFKALELISQQDGCKKLPLVLVSSNSDPDDVRMAYQLGAHSCIDKALGADEVAKQLQFLERLWRGSAQLIPAASSLH